MAKVASAASRVVPATEFKAHCLALIDRVAAGEGAIVISKRGKPVAQLVPVGPRAPRRPGLLGSVRIVDRDDDLASTGVPWEADERGSR